MAPTQAAGPETELCAATWQTWWEPQRKPTGATLKNHSLLLLLIQCDRGSSNLWGTAGRNSWLEVFGSRHHFQFFVHKDEHGWQKLDPPPNKIKAKIKTVSLHFASAPAPCLCWPILCHALRGEASDGRVYKHWKIFHVSVSETCWPGSVSWLRRCLIAPPDRQMDGSLNRLQKQLLTAARIRQTKHTHTVGRGAACGQTVTFSSPKGPYFEVTHSG